MEAFDGEQQRVGELSKQFRNDEEKDSPSQDMACKGFSAFLLLALARDSSRGSCIEDHSLVAVAQAWHLLSEADVALVEKLQR